ILILLGGGKRSARAGDNDLDEELDRSSEEESDEVFDESSKVKRSDEE
nr:hypothetical protein [Tanacetum cinerariifolium]